MEEHVAFVEAVRDARLIQPAARDVGGETPVGRVGRGTADATLLSTDDRRANRLVADSATLGEATVGTTLRELNCACASFCRGDWGAPPLTEADGGRSPPVPVLLTLGATRPMDRSRSYFEPE